MQYVAALISISLGALAQYFFKTGVTAVSNREIATFEVIKCGMTNLYILGGLFCYGFGLLLWFYVLSKMELSRAYPLVSLGYVFTMILGYFLLNESITFPKVAGIILIVAGVFALTR